MRDDICTIPVSEIFEVNDGCPICRMINMVEHRIIDYVMGDAMMEPDIRIETNRLGFCEKHYNDMFAKRGRLQLALILQTHIDEINKNIFTKNIFVSPAKKGERAKKVSDTCFVCEKVEYGISRMIDTIYRCYENERDFRELFNNQDMFCLPHYERLITGIEKRGMKNYATDFTKKLTRITEEYSKQLYKNISDYCTIYDYRSNKEEISKEKKEAVERVIAFLNGRCY